MEYLEKNIVVDSKINSVYYYHALQLFSVLGYVDKDRNIKKINEKDLQKNTSIF